MQRQVRERRWGWIGCGVLHALRTAGVSSVRGSVRGLSEAIPPQVGSMRTQCEPGRSGALARCNLEDVAIAIRVVSDHIEHESSDHADGGYITSASVLGREGEALLDKRLAKCARAHAICWKFLAGQVNEPHVSLELASSRERQQVLGCEQQRGRRRVVIVGSTSRC